MFDEFEPEYREIDVKALAHKLPGVKWSLVAMAIVCFAAAAYAFVTPAWASATLLSAMPWFAIVGGLLAFLGTVLTRAPWTVSWAEPIVGVVLIAGGLATLWYPSLMVSVSGTCGVFGLALAFYVLFTALEMYARGAGQWLVELAIAAVVWVAAFMSLMGVMGLSGQGVIASLVFFVAAWGFVYGAAALSRVERIMGGFPKNLYESDERGIRLTKSGMRVANLIWEELG